MNGKNGMPVETAEPVRQAGAVRSARAVPRPPRAVRPARAGADFASASVPRHLLRGVLGFGLIIGSIALVPVAGPAPLLAAPLGLVALRGCPTCWLIGLAQTVSRGRLERKCADGVCTLSRAGG
ncbi:hypothetical protein ACFYVL_04800 [Streptomyces sp. NPDC004111]|uniref:hypothetical protein n=1 Tax=Streptomyces sp. NPDC004111 TaxID=3364690 RepID=UPI0036C6B9A2